MDPLGRPIKPSEVVNLKCQRIPEIVFNAFNNQIALSWDGRKAIVRQEHVVNEILASDEKFSREEIFRKHMLDVEEIYEQEGWSVEFDKPGGGESYGAFWTFRKA